jgi:hypothetical protein
MDQTWRVLNFEIGFGGKFYLNGAKPGQTEKMAILDPRAWLSLWAVLLGFVQLGDSRLMRSAWVTSPRPIQAASLRKASSSRHAGISLDMQMIPSKRLRRSSPMDNLPQRGAEILYSALLILPLPFFWNILNDKALMERKLIRELHPGRL